MSVLTFPSTCLHYGIRVWLLFLRFKYRFIFVSAWPSFMRSPFVPRTVSGSLFSPVVKVLLPRLSTNDSRFLLSGRINETPGSRASFERPST